MESAIFLLVIAVLVVGSLFWQSTRSQDIVHNWARDNGYHLLEVNFSFFKGPFFWTSSRGQTVYRVVVQDQAGRTRSGWVRCGSWFSGLLSNTADVRWDD